MVERMGSDGRIRWIPSAGRLLGWLARMLQSNGHTATVVHVVHELARAIGEKVNLAALAADGCCISPVSYRQGGVHRSDRHCRGGAEALGQVLNMTPAGVLVGPQRGAQWRDMPPSRSSATVHDEPEGELGV